MSKSTTMYEIAELKKRINDLESLSALESGKAVTSVNSANSDAIIEIITNVAKVVCFTVGVLFVIGICLLLRDTRPYGYYSRYWW